MQKGAVMSDKKKKLVAYHEAGHAIVGALMPEYDPVTKISIVPRGAAGGLTFFAPSEERLESGLYSRTVRAPHPSLRFPSSRMLSTSINLSSVHQCMIFHMHADCRSTSTDA